MNKTLITAATVAIAALSAFANVAQAAEAEGNQWLDAATTVKTRVQVNEELQAARANGTVGFAGSTYKWLERSQAVTTRAEVTGEFRAARAAGTLPTIGEGFDGTAHAAHAARPAAASRTVAGL